MPTPTYTLIDSVTLATATASVTFSGISATGKGDLVLVVNATTSTITSLRQRFNADSSSTYSSVIMGGTSSTGSVTRDFPLIDWGFYSFPRATAGYIGIQTIADFASTDKHKSTLLRSNNASDGTEAIASRWPSTAAINAIEIYAASGTISVGSTFHLYQIVSE
jgi:hypothetical protein